MQLYGVVEIYSVKNFLHLFNTPTVKTFETTYRAIRINPVVTRVMPIQSFSKVFSPKNITAKIATRTILNLSMTITLDALPF
jgi:hypothetical protein